MIVNEEKEYVDQPDTEPPRAVRVRNRILQLILDLVSNFKTRKQVPMTSIPRFSALLQTEELILSVLGYDWFFVFLEPSVSDRSVVLALRIIGHLLQDVGGPFSAKFWWVIPIGFQF